MIKTTGSGVGLSLCKQIMLLHKGRILVNSKEGEGSIFTLIF
ncbi:ATP-binding protein [Polaribacter sp.]|nr:ATP-binding protein [Polaribacter sp.]